METPSTSSPPSGSLDGFVENRPDGSVWSRELDKRNEHVHYIGTSPVAKASRIEPTPPLPPPSARRKPK